MRAKRSYTAIDKPLAENELVRIEMRSFLKALASYPECFAINPQITFEQHRTSLVSPGTDSARASVQPSA